MNLKRLSFGLLVIFMFLVSAFAVFSDNITYSAFTPANGSTTDETTIIYSGLVTLNNTNAYENFYVDFSSGVNLSNTQDSTSPLVVTDCYFNNTDCLSFDGIDDKILLDDSIKFTTNFTYSIWMIANKWNTYPFARNNELSFGVYPDGGMGKFRATAVNGTGYYELFRYDGFDLFDDNWHLLVITYNGTMWKGYIDGDYVINSTLASGGILDTQPAYLGWYTGASNHYNGSLQKFRAFDSVLTAEEIQLIYNTSSVPLVTNGLFNEDVSDWLSYSQANLTWQNATPAEGAGYLRIGVGAVNSPHARQNDVLTLGTRYRLTGCLRESGSSEDARIYFGSTAVYDSSGEVTDWDCFDVDVVATTGTHILLYCNGVAANIDYCEYDNITITPYPDYDYRLDSFYDAEVNCTFNLQGEDQESFLTSYTEPFTVVDTNQINEDGDYNYSLSCFDEGFANDTLDNYFTIGETALGSSGGGSVYMNTAPIETKWYFDYFDGGNANLIKGFALFGLIAFVIHTLEDLKNKKRRRRK